MTQEHNQPSPPRTTQHDGTPSGKKFVAAEPPAPSTPPGAAGANNTGKRTFVGAGLPTPYVPPPGAPQGGPVRSAGAKPATNNARAAAPRPGFAPRSPGDPNAVTPAIPMPAAGTSKPTAPIAVAKNKATVLGGASAPPANARSAIPAPHDEHEHPPHVREYFRSSRPGSVEHLSDRPPAPAEPPHEDFHDLFAEPDLPAAKSPTRDGAGRTHIDEILDVGVTPPTEQFRPPPLPHVEQPTVVVEGSGGPPPGPAPVVVPVFQPHQPQHSHDGNGNGTFPPGKSPAGWDNDPIEPPIDRGPERALGIGCAAIIALALVATLGWFVLMPLGRKAMDIWNRPWSWPWQPIPTAPPVVQPPPSPNPAPVTSAPGQLLDPVTHCRESNTVAGAVDNNAMVYCCRVRASDIKPANSTDHGVWVRVDGQPMPSELGSSGYSQVCIPGNAPRVRWRQ